MRNETCQVPFFLPKRKNKKPRLDYSQLVLT